MKAIGRCFQGLRSGGAKGGDLPSADPGPQKDEGVGRIRVSSFALDLFDKIGLRHKYRGEPWEALYPNFRVPQRAVDDLPHLRRHG
jgi:hypothetical protein